MEEVGGFIAGEPVGESSERVEVVVVLFELLLCHWRENYIIGEHFIQIYVISHYRF